MLRAGTVRRVRQTLLATNLASGALVAWKVPAARLDAAFDFMSKEDPFSGHVVLRSTDAATAGSDYKLWTTLKVPRGFSLQEHGELLTKIVGAEGFLLMPAKGIFVLGVGHVRRKTIEPGARAEQPAEITRVEAVELDAREWRVLLALKRELSPDEITGESPWIARAREAGVSFDEFCAVAKALQTRKLIGRFSTFLEHVKPSETGVRVTRFNAPVPLGRAGGTRDQGGRRGGSAPHPDALLLARGRTGIRQRQHHGGGPRHGKRPLARAQSGHRRSPARGWHPGFLHERVLGRAQRNQAVRNFSFRLPGVAAKNGRKIVGQPPRRYFANPLISR